MKSRMKSLKQYIGNYTRDFTNESLLDDEDTILDDDTPVVEDWINEHYDYWGNLTIRQSDSKKYPEKYIADCSAMVRVKQKYRDKMTSLTNGMFRWGNVDGGFVCKMCKNLKSLEGAPEKVSGDFSCYDCDNLRSLEGAPKYVGAIFTCILCENLTSLKGAPKEVGRVFNCSYCDNLRSLKGAPEKVGGDFYCSNCKKLIVTDEDRKKYNIMN